MKEDKERRKIENQRIKKEVDVEKEANKMRERGRQRIKRMVEKG